MDGSYSSNGLETDHVAATAYKLRFVARRFTLAPAVKPGAALPMMAPFFGLSYSKLYELIFRNIPKVRLSAIDRLLVRRGKVAAHRWLAEWHRKRAEEEEYLADCEEAEMHERLQLSFAWGKECPRTESLRHITA